ncbi:hypothetical protein DFH06DRAFT_1141350 [Mycena polygramma]|nr:hypothetical protein DFH06DRAFT_1141350 [Mycena polygramma]
MNKVGESMCDLGTWVIFAVLENAEKLTGALAESTRAGTAERLRINLERSGRMSVKYFGEVEDRTGRKLCARRSPVACGRERNCRYTTKWKVDLGTCYQTEFRRYMESLGKERDRTPLVVTVVHALTMQNRNFRGSVDADAFIAGQSILQRPTPRHELFGTTRIIDARMSTHPPVLEIVQIRHCDNPRVPRQGGKMRDVLVQDGWITGIHHLQEP